MHFPSPTTKVSIPRFHFLCFHLYTINLILFSLDLSLVLGIFWFQSAYRMHFHLRDIWHLYWQIKTCKLVNKFGTIVHNTAGTFAGGGRWRAHDRRRAGSRPNAPGEQSRLGLYYPAPESRMPVQADGKVQLGTWKGHGWVVHHQLHDIHSRPSQGLRRMARNGKSR